MELALPIDAFVGVTSEEISLCLDQVRRQSSTTVLVVVLERGGKSRCGDAGGDAHGNYASPGQLPRVHLRGEGLIQKKIGKINYFPLKAVQTFDTTTEPMAITNGIYVGDVALVRFFGPFEFNEGTRKLTFDFDEISLLGLRIPLPKGGAAQIGAASGLGSKSNVARAKRELPAFFNWISANEDIATARGGGGGLALWRRDLEAQERMRE